MYSKFEVDWDRNSPAPSYNPQKLFFKLLQQILCHLRLMYLYNYYFSPSNKKTQDKFPESSLMAFGKLNIKDVTPSAVP